MINRPYSEEEIEALNRIRRRMQGRDYENINPEEYTK